MTTSPHTKAQLARSCWLEAGLAVARIFPPLAGTMLLMLLGIRTACIHAVDPFDTVLLLPYQPPPPAADQPRSHRQADGTRTAPSSTTPTGSMFTVVP